MAIIAGDPIEIEAARGRVAAAKDRERRLRALVDLWRDTAERVPEAAAVLRQCASGLDACLMSDTEFDARLRAAEGP